MLANLACESSPMKTAEAILRISPSRPDRLFPGDDAQVHQLYHRLVSYWHPDRNKAPLATDVFQHIVTLYAQAKEQIASGKWRSSHGERTLTTRDGRQYRIKHCARRTFELGEILIGSTMAAFIVTPDASDLSASALSMLKAFRFATQDMRQQIAPCLPEMQAALETHEGCALIIKKPTDNVLLADLVEHLGGTVPAVHVAWMLSSLYNLACWLEWAQITHNAIAPDTVFVSPQRHTIALYGGWWYAVRTGERLTALPTRTVANAPQDIVRGKVADQRCDLELIRATGRELLGDNSGIRLLRDPSIPRPMAEWLCHPSTGSALTDYRFWRDVLVASFGARRFVRLDVTSEQLYSTAH
jgi:hypothetical protein